MPRTRDLTTRTGTGSRPPRRKAGAVTRPVHPDRALRVRRDKYNQAGREPLCHRQVDHMYGRRSTVMIVAPRPHSTVRASGSDLKIITGSGRARAVAKASLRSRVGARTAGRPSPAGQRHLGRSSVTGSITTRERDHSSAGRFALGWTISTSVAALMMTCRMSARARACRPVAPGRAAPPWPVPRCPGPACPRVSTSGSGRVRVRGALLLASPPESVTPGLGLPRR